MTYVPPSDTEKIDLLIDQVARLTEGIVELRLFMREGFNQLRAAGERTERTVDRLATIVENMADRQERMAEFQERQAEIEAERHARSQQKLDRIASLVESMTDRQERMADRQDRNIDRLVGIVETLIQQRP